MDWLLAAIDQSRIHDVSQLFARHIRMFNVAEDGSLSGGDVFYHRYDVGICCDSES